MTSSELTATFGISGLRSVGTTMKRAAKTGIAPNKMIIGRTKFFHSLILCSPTLKVSSYHQ
ncbi:MAG: hypothetical protein D4R90_03845 [Nitrosopumilales archaeon]|nr:MAG: hypothetical protein D4R90_03845 [Nitrosopumilales archaeon]